MNGIPNNDAALMTAPEAPSATATVEGLSAVACSQLVVTRVVYEALVKEMQGMQQLENKAAADRNWSMADALKQKRP